MDNINWGIITTLFLSLVGILVALFNPQANHFVMNCINKLSEMFLFRNMLIKRLNKDYLSYRCVTGYISKPIDLKNIKFEINEKKYKLKKLIHDTDLEKHIEKCKKFHQKASSRSKVILYDGRATRLDGFERINENSFKIKLQSLNYFDYVKIHLSADAAFKVIKFNKKTPNSLREYLERKKDKKLYLKLPRVLGINIFLKTADDYIILHRRSKTVNFNQNELYPTASGSIQLIDGILLGKDNVDTELKKFILSKEIYDEVGIFPHNIDVLEFIGIFEDEDRLFVPDIFFIGKTNLEYESDGNYPINKIFEDNEDRLKKEILELVYIHIKDFWKLKGKEFYKKYKISQNLKVYLENEEIIKNSKFDFGKKLG